MRMLEVLGPAPALQVDEWLNTKSPLALEQLKGKVVVLHAFQMLCPACVQLATPQMQKLQDLFGGDEVAVIGLHTVFEHHDAMRIESLRAFLHEFRVRFPVGIDAPDPDGGRLPQTMRAYDMQGTPTTLLIDARGRLRRQVFGVHDDLLLGAELQSLILEAEQDRATAAPDASPVA